jgi:hypothetical protein
VLAAAALRNHELAEGAKSLVGLDTTRSDPLHFQKLKGKSLVTCVTKFGGLITQEALTMSGRRRTVLDSGSSH